MMIIDLTETGAAGMKKEMKGKKMKRKKNNEVQKVKSVKKTTPEE
jgi:hypothetical protein